MSTPSHQLTSSRTIQLLDWAIWLPGLPGRDAWTSAWREWQQGGKPLPADEGQTPDVSFLPAMFRRRLSRHSKLALRVAHDSLPEAYRADCRSIFASRHGDLRRTLRLLGQMARGEPLSPTDFAMSVHNTNSGLFGIWAENQQPSSALAAGPQTVAVALLDALMQATEHPEVPILLVINEEELVPPYKKFDTLSPVTGALALLLGQAEEPANGHNHWRWSSQPDQAPAEAAASPWLQLAGWLADDQPELALALGGGVLRLHREKA